MNRVPALAIACLLASAAGAQAAQPDLGTREPILQEPVIQKPDTQGPVAREPAPQDPAALRRAARTAIAAWVGSDWSDQKLLDRAIEKILDAEDGGLRELAATMREGQGRLRDRRGGIDALMANTILSILEQRSNSGMVFDGQYDDLRILQPGGGSFLVELLVNTPNWFPDDQRHLVVPALRDVYEKSPGEAVIDRCVEIVKDRDFEAEALREALTFALAQWGRREFVQVKIDRCSESAGDGTDTDELYFVGQLAVIHYQLREYTTAAATWQRYLDGLAALEQEPTTHDYYNAACCMALAGRGNDALQAIERCAQLIADGQMASSSPLTRTMFATDPDLRSIRGQKRFAAATTLAFGSDEGDAGGERRTTEGDGGR